MVSKILDILKEITIKYTAFKGILNVMEVKIISRRRKSIAC
jgi:hypothetical protein